MLQDNLQIIPPQRLLSIAKISPNRVVTPKFMYQNNLDGSNFDVHTTLIRNPKFYNKKVNLSAIITLLVTRRESKTKEKVEKEENIIMLSTQSLSHLSILAQ